MTITRTLGQVQATPALEGAPGTEVALTRRDLADADPIGLITRLANRLAQLEPAKAKALAEVDRARGEIEHATASIGKPFPQAADLTAARERSRQIDDQLEAAAAPQPAEAEPDSRPEAPPALAQTTAVPDPGQDRAPQRPTAQLACPANDPGPTRPPWPSAVERAAGPVPSHAYNHQLARRLERGGDREAGQ